MTSSCHCPPTTTKPKFFISFLVTLSIISLYYLLNHLGFFSLVQVNSTSSVIFFFLFGLLAGFSTCFATVGGLVVSLVGAGSTPVWQFLLGRLLSFSLFGGLLGYFGKFFRLSFDLGIIINILVSLFLLSIALSMLRLVRLPSLAIKSYPRLPLVLGALTFFLPCGFTLTAQSLALASGSPLVGATIMTFFVLGTLVPLLLIGLNQHQLSPRSKFSSYFSQITALLILVFSLQSIISQLISLNLVPNPSPPTRADIPSRQLLQMTATAAGYSPNYFKIPAGQPIRWEITDRGTSGCTNAIIAPQLFPGQIDLHPDNTSVREFIAPSVPGVYRFSCWMGMVNGTIEVVN